MIEISKRLVLINSASAAVARVANVAILFWMHQHLVRRLSAEEYSLYPVIMGLTVFVPLLSIVLTGGMSRYVVEAYSREDRGSVVQIVSTMFPLLLAAGIVVLVGGGLFAWHIDAIVKVAPERLWDARIMMGLMVLLVAVGLPLAPFQVGLYVKQKFIWISLLAVGAQLIRVTVLVVLLLGVSTRIIWVPVATVSAELTRHLVVLIISQRLIPMLKFRVASIRWRTAGKLMSFGWWTLVAKLADTLRTGVNPLILKNLAGAFDVVCFNVGWMFFYQIQLATTTLTSPVLPAMTAMYAHGDKDRLRRTYLRGGRYALWAVMLAATPLIVFRESLITLYVGSEYLMAGSVMALLLLQFPMSHANIMLYNVAYAVDRMRPLALWLIITQVATLALTLWLVASYEMGAMGAAVSSTVVAAIACPLFLYPLGLRMVDAPIWSLVRETMIPGFAPMMAGGVVWLGVGLVVSPSSWVALALCFLAGALVYIVVLWAFCLQVQERRDLVAALGRAKARFWPAADTA